MSDKAMFDSILKNNNNLIIKKTKEQEIIDTKLTIISLAYTDSLSKNDLLELSVILENISDFKSSTNKKKGL